MGYDIFSQPQGPVIPISLYSDAASRGINAGNAQKTTLQNIVGGVISGVQTAQSIYDNYQTSQIKQHQIDRQDEEDAIRDEYAESLEMQNEIRRQQMEAAQATQEDDLNTEVLQSKMKNQQAQIQAKDSKNILNLTELQTSENTDEAVAALGTPEMMGTLSRYPQMGQQYVSTLRQRGVPAEVLDPIDARFKELIRSQKVSAANSKLQSLGEKALEKDELSAGRFENYKNVTPEFSKIVSAGNFDPKLLDLVPSKTLNAQKTPIGYDYVYGNQIIKPNAILKDQYKDKFEELQAWKKTHVHVAGPLDPTLQKQDTAAATEQPVSDTSVQSAAPTVGPSLPPSVESDKFLMGAVKIGGFAPGIVDQAAPSFKKLNTELSKFKNVPSLESPATKQMLNNTVTQTAKEISNTLYKTTPSLKSQYTMADVEAYNNSLTASMELTPFPGTKKSDFSITPSNDLLESMKVKTPEELYFVTQGSTLVKQVNTFALATLSARKKAIELQTKRSGSNVAQTNILSRMANGG